MVRKRQVIIALSVVTIALLLGTVTMTAQGGWREYLALWEAINQIQEELAEKQAELEGIQEELEENQEMLGEIQEGLEDLQSQIVGLHVSTTVTVWYDKHMPPNTAKASYAYNASGYGHLHILAWALNFTGTEKMRLKLVGLLWDPTHTSYHAAAHFSYDLTPNSNTISTTVPVPSEEFYFIAQTWGSDCDVSLSFYLTWA